MAVAMTEQMLTDLLKRELGVMSADLQKAMKKDLQNLMNILEVWGSGPREKPNLSVPNSSRRQPQAVQGASLSGAVSIYGGSLHSRGAGLERPNTAKASSAWEVDSLDGSHEWIARHPRCKAWELTIASEHDRSLPRAFVRDKEGSISKLNSEHSFPALSSTPRTSNRTVDISAAPATPVGRQLRGTDLQLSASATPEGEENGSDDMQNGEGLGSNTHTHSDVHPTSPMFKPYQRHLFSGQVDLSSRWSCVQRWNLFAYTVFASDKFEYFVGFLVLLNTLAVAAQTDYVARNRLSRAPWSFRLVERSFCGVFLAEIGIRITVYRSRFLKVWMWEWNVFDIIVVGLQCFEELLLFCLEASEDLRINFTFMRILHWLRIIRIIRTIRILRFIEDLRNLVMALGHSLKTLVWAVLLLFLIIFVFGVWLTQLVSDNRIRNGENSGTLKYFGSLGDSLLSLFQAVTGGFDWRDAASALMSDMHPLIAIAFCVYVAVAVLAVMNIVTGVFVDAALQSAREDKDYFIINNVRELFAHVKGEQAGLLTWEDFEFQLNAGKKDSTVFEYFKAMDVDPSEAKGLFQLLDLDNDGSIDAEEFLSGCLRLRGPAKSMDLALLMHEVRRIANHVRILENAIKHSDSRPPAPIPTPKNGPKPPEYSQPTPLSVPSAVSSAVCSQSQAASMQTTAVQELRESTGPRAAGSPGTGTSDRMPPSVIFSRSRPETPPWGGGTLA